MKISKQKKMLQRESVRAAENTSNQSKYVKANASIKAAIDELGKIACATKDEGAKEAIANLSVVLLDLKSRE